ncbi:MAG: polysaccharide deacetylase family protein [bacterium]
MLNVKGSDFLKILMFATALGAFGCAADDSSNATNDDPNGYSEDGVAAWGDAYEERSSGKSDEPGCSGVIVPDRNGFGGRVALTFDDGPEPASTNIVLDVLKRHNIKATFFINGRRVDTDADRAALKRIIDEGHILANHSQNHSNLKTLDLAKVESEVDRTHTIIQQAGVEPLYFRFPFGSSSCQTADLVHSFGYRVTGWHVDSADWCFANSRGGVGYCDPATFKYVPDSLRDDMVGLVLEQAQQKNGGILLFHDVHMNTANNLDEVITRLEAANFSFVNIDDVGTFPLLNSDDVNDFSFTGTPCTDNTTCDFSANASCLTFDNAGTPAGFCTIGCDGYCDDFPGRAPTFCVSLDGTTGSCVSKSGVENRNCEALPGTAPILKDRFIGASSARPSTATVCLPEGL